jgi:hypothetical protein
MRYAEDPSYRILTGALYGVTCQGSSTPGGNPPSDSRSETNLQPQELLPLLSVVIAGNIKYRGLLSRGVPIAGLGLNLEG